MWSRLNFSDKLAFFNLWHITSTIGDAMLVIGSGLTFSRELGLRADSHERYKRIPLACQLYPSSCHSPCTPEETSCQTPHCPLPPQPLSDGHHACHWRLPGLG